MSRNIRREQSGDAVVNATNRRLHAARRYFESGPVAPTARRRLDRRAGPSCRPVGAVGDQPADRPAGGKEVTARRERLDVQLVALDEARARPELTLEGSDGGRILGEPLLARAKGPVDRVGALELVLRRSPQRAAVDTARRHDPDENVREVLPVHGILQPRVERSIHLVVVEKSRRGTLADALVADGWSVRGIDSFTAYYDRKVKERNLATARTHPSFTLHEVDLREADLPPLLDGAVAIFH